jgi:antitoxin component YwqK of YwqJK toxin-antitoxin module
MYSRDSGVELFELFYEDEQPKFRFSYKIDEEDGVTGSYCMFYDNGQMKEEGSISYNDSSFERYSKEGKLIETFCNDVVKKYE